MEKIYGHNQKAVGRNKRKAFMGNRYSYGSLVFLCLIPLLSGCAALKKTALIAGASSIGAGAGGILSGTVGRIAGAATGATAGVIATGVNTQKGEPLAVTAETVVQEAPSNFWDILGELISMGGWLLILIVVVPMVLGWIIPGPLTTHKKKR